jgi:hypothetical protein
MTSPARPGFLGRLWTVLGGGLARGLLGQSAHAHMKQFTGSDDYWDRAIAAQMAWPRERPRGADRGPPGGPTAGDTARVPPGPEHELVPGWTESQLFDTLARSPTHKVYLRI